MAVLQDPDTVLTGNAQGYIVGQIFNDVFQVGPLLAPLNMHAQAESSAGSTHIILLSICSVQLFSNVNSSGPAHNL